MNGKPIFAGFLTVVFLAESARAGDTIRFDRDVRPILAEKCFACHGADEADLKGDLRLDDRQAALESRAIVPGKPDQSELVRRIRSTDEAERMPPPESHKTLSADEIALLEAHVFLDPEAPPDQIMLQWYDAKGSWDHRSYWGESKARWGVEGTPSRLPLGSLPRGASGSALRAAGLLSERIGGPPVFPAQPTDYYAGKQGGWRWNESAGPDRFRRGMYTFWRRTTPYPTFVIFDAPDRSECSMIRSSSRRRRPSPGT